MIQQVDDSRRLVVPRWRPFRVAAGLGLLDSPGDATIIEPSAGELEGLVADWRQYGSPFHAANLVDLAVVLGEPEIATDAAQFIVSSVSEDLPEFKLARFLVQLTGEAVSETPPHLSRTDRYRRIAEARRSLRRQPWNPILLVDLARDYSTLGQNEPAMKALRRALGIAPDNRFVVRAASRFFLHAGDPGEAHAVVRRTGRSKSDPWLLAAEIVAASAAGRTSRLIGLAQDMVRDENIAPRYTTELASALGTLEHTTGNLRAVRRLFTHALKEPTENTVAQAAWISRHMPSFQVPDISLAVPRAFEANAWGAAIRGQYEAAVDLAWEWLRDEPFATRAALFGTHIASVALGRFETGEEIASVARIANPHDPRLILELIYCVASQGRVNDAEQLLVGELPAAVSRYPGVVPPATLRVIQTADRGLLAFRRGDVESGRMFYRQAIALAREADSGPLEASALLHFLREEALANLAAEIPWEQARQVLQAFPASVRPFYERLLSRIVTIRLTSRRV